MSNSTSYNQLAYVYDHLMADAPYDLWLEFVEKHLRGINSEPVSVIDLACGTGAMTVLLAQKGYRMMGIDISDNMLAVTNDKARERGLDVSLYEQDMRDFVVPASADAVICLCDSINYLTDEVDVQQTFSRVYQALKPNGVFLFDTHSLYKIHHIFGDHTFTWTDDDIAYIWECELSEGDSVLHDLNIFVKAGTLYERFQEFHVQRGYAEEDLISWLEAAGFTNIQCTADFTYSQSTPTSERLLFSAVRK